MKRSLIGLAFLILPLSGYAQQDKSPLADNRQVFPDASFLLHDMDRPIERPKAVFGPVGKDANGSPSGSIAFYGGSSLIQVLSLSFSNDGKLLAVGSTPSLVDVWDVDHKKKLRSFTGGTVVALSPDGTLLARDPNGIEVDSVVTGKPLLKIKWTGGQIRGLSFDPTSKWLLVSANGNDDKVFDLTTGQLIADLTHTRPGRFSRDGSLLIGGDYKHLVTWDTHTWKTIRDLPNGPDYVTTTANNPESDLEVVGGPNSARLLSLSSGSKIADVGQGYTNFASFDQTGSFVLTYTSKGFGVWDENGKLRCSKENMGNGTMALSADGRYLASAQVSHGTDVLLWSLPQALEKCMEKP